MSLGSPRGRDETRAARRPPGRRRGGVRAAGLRVVATHARPGPRLRLHRGLGRGGRPGDLARRDQGARPASRAARRCGPGSTGSWSTPRRPAASRSTGPCPGAASPARTPARAWTRPCSSPPARPSRRLAGGAGRVARRRSPSRARCWPVRSAASCGTALDALPDRQRIVLTLRDVLGHTSEEVCEMLEISQANQRVLLHRARTAVRAGSRRTWRGAEMAAPELPGDGRARHRLPRGHPGLARPPPGRQAPRAPATAASATSTQMRETLDLLGTVPVDTLSPRRSRRCSTRSAT